MRAHGQAEIPQAFPTSGASAPKTLPFGSGRAAYLDRFTYSLFSKRRWYVRGFFVVLFVVLATLLRLWLDSVFHLQLRYLTYFPTVFLVASLFGTAEGIYATIASLLLAVDPFAPGAIAQLTTANRVAVVFLAVSGVVLSLVAGALRTRTERLHRAIELLQSSRENARDDRRRFHEAKTRFDSIIASSDEAIIGKDMRGIVTSWNNGAENIFGYTADEIIGRPIQCLLPAGHESEEEEILTHILRGEVVEKLDARRMARDGHIVHLNLTISPIRDAAGNIIGASKVARDISEQLKLQRQLQQSQKMEAVGQLAGGIAHDFNNLLAIITGALELQLPALAGNAEATQRWEVANRAAIRGAELTRRLLAFSSQEHFKVASTDLNHSIRNTMEMAQRLIGPEIKVHLNLEKSMSNILVDPSGLESAVLNLVINARDAMLPSGGSLTVGTRTAELEQDFTATLTGSIRPGSYACISITDTGCGMSQEVLDRACEPFFTTKERGRGTGLGLSMVYGFVKYSGGGIRIYSEPGYGTTITFYLPFDRNAPPVSRPKEEPKAEIRRSGRILTVDDEAELLDISVSYLTARGYVAVSAHDGKEALRMLAEDGPFDVLVTDIVMGGGMDGMELAQTVHRLYPEVRIIYSSGFPADALSERSLPLADALVLQKPYRLSELGASIDQALGIRQVLTPPALSRAGQPGEDAFAAPASSCPFN